MKRYILALLAVTSFISNTNARVSLLKYYDYQNNATTQNSFDECFDKSTDLIRGYILKLYGTTQVQRFYGNIRYVRGENEKACSYRDAGNDALASLLVALYPSAGPDFNSGGTGSLENFFTNPKDLVQVVADMLYFANRARGLFLKNFGEIGTQIESIKELSYIINDLEKVDRLDPDYDGITETLSGLLKVGSKHAGLISAQVIEEEKNIINKLKSSSLEILADYLDRPLAIAKRAKAKIEQDLFNQVFRGDEVFKFWNGSEAKTRTKLERIARAIVGSVMLERLNEKEEEENLKRLKAYNEDLTTYINGIDKYKEDLNENNGMYNYKWNLNSYRYALDKYESELNTNEDFDKRRSELDELKNNLSEDEKKLEVYEKLEEYRNNLDAFKDKLDAYSKVYKRNLEIHPYPLGYTNDVICMYAWDVLNSDEIGLLAERLGEHKKALQKDFPIGPCDKALTKKMVDNYKVGVFPFALGTIFNGTAHYKTSRGFRAEFADCAETAMRLFFAAMFAKAENGEIRLDESRIPEGNLKNFFKGKDLQELSADGHSEVRDEWVKIISGKEAYNAGISFVKLGEKSTGDAYELIGTIGNFIWTFCWLMKGYPKLVEKELNISDISSYEAPVGISEKDLRKIKAAKRIDSIVKAVDRGGSVKKKQKIVEKLATTIDEAIEIYNDLLGIRDDVKLETVKGQVVNYTSMAFFKKVDGMIIRDVSNPEDHFDLITNGHAEVNGTSLFDYDDKDIVDVVEDANSGFHNTLKLYNYENKTYEKSYPLLNYYMHVAGNRYNTSEDDYQIPGEVIRDPLFERQVSGVCKLLLTRNFSVSDDHDLNTDGKIVKKNCNLLVSRLINGADASNFAERLERLVNKWYIPLNSLILPLNLSILKDSLSRIHAILSGEDKTTTEEDASVLANTIASPEEKADKSKESKSDKEKANKQYVKMVKNVINFIDLFEFTANNTDIVDGVKKAVAIIKKEAEERGLTESFPLDMGKTANKLTEKVNILSEVCKFKIVEEVEE